MGEPARSSGTDDFMRPGIGEWGRVLGHLKDEVGETAYRSWLQSLRVERVDQGEAVLVAPTSFLRNWVATHYANRLLALWRLENPAVERLSLIVDPQVTTAPRAKARIAEPTEAPAIPVMSAELAEDKGNLSAPLDRH